MSFHISPRRRMKRSLSPPRHDEETRLTKRRETERRAIMRKSLWPRPIETEKRVIEHLIHRASIAWFIVKELLAHFLVPLEIGPLIIEFFTSYDCVGCSSLITLQRRPYPITCLACYNLQNGDYGLLCRDCALFSESCIYCDYTQCDAHFSQPSHCLLCDSFLCNHCSVNCNAENGLCYSCQ